MNTKNRQLRMKSLVTTGTTSWWISFVLALLSVLAFGVLVYRIEPLYTILYSFILTTEGTLIFRLWFLVLVFWCSYLHLRTIWRKVRSGEQRYYWITILMGAVLLIGGVIFMGSMLY